MTAPTLPAPASRHSLALLRFPDPRTDWVVVVVATLRRPAADLEDRLARLHRAVPLVGARLHHEVWVPGTAPAPETVAADPLLDPSTDRAFALADEPPLRVVVGADGTRLAVVGHHAAFDGLALVAVLDALTGGPVPRPAVVPPAGPAGSPRAALHRLARPADRVAPTPGIWPRDAYASASAPIRGPGVTGRLAEAAVRAAVAHQAHREAAPLRRVGLTIAVGGPPGVGNVASYRRIDQRPDDTIAESVRAALATVEEPGEQVRAPKLLLRALVPVVGRLSDTLLVSNLGRHRLEGVERIEFFPVARGRSAVALGSASVTGGDTTITLRARDLSPGDADRFLAHVADELRASAPDHPTESNASRSRSS